MMYLLSPLIILLAFAAYSVLHSVLAATPVKDWARQRFGEEPVRRGYRLFFNAVGVVTLLPILALVLWLPDQPLYVVPPLLQPIFLAGQVLGMLGLAYSLAQTDVLDFAGVRQLSGSSRQPQPVTGGAYAWVRHPLYTGTMLFLWLIPSMTLNWLAFILGVSLYFIIGAQYEERKLEKFYGKAYREYRARTPMFIPWPRRS
jgi:protein-S-isoprenylcysteine O-methyltransferase Ste14